MISGRYVVILTASDHGDGGNAFMGVGVGYALQQGYISYLLPISQTHLIKPSINRICLVILRKLYLHCFNINFIYKILRK